MEVVELHSCKNLPRTLLDARAKGWAVLGAAADVNASSVRSVSVSEPTILVMGSEGAGLRTNVRRACSALVKVDMGPAARGAHVAIDSLNVSVATGILLHDLLASARTHGAKQQ